MATWRNIAIGLLYLAEVTQVARTLQAIGRDRTRILSYLPHETRDERFCRPRASRPCAITNAPAPNDTAGGPSGSLG